MTITSTDCAPKSWPIFSLHLFKSLKSFIRLNLFTLLHNLHTDFELDYQRLKLQTITDRNKNVINNDEIIFLQSKN